MKKIMITLGVLAVLLVGGFSLLQHFIMGGTEYYVQITTDGEKIDGKDDSGNPIVSYRYELPGYDEEGDSKTLNFDSFAERPLRKTAYLKVTWNKNKGVTSWEEVQKNQIPTKALTHLDSKG